MAYAGATGLRDPLAIAQTAADWTLANRKLTGGGFRHGENDRDGPFLGDTLAMGQALLDLYGATGDRNRLMRARDAADFIAATFRQRSGGFATSATRAGKTGVLAEPVIAYDEQVRVARFANLLFRYTADRAYRELAEHAVRYLTSNAILASPRPLAGVLLAVNELEREPTHITIVGHKNDPSAEALHIAARAYPGTYKRVDWWDRREGPLPNADVAYPELERAAAFACTDRICSLPVFEPSGLGPAVTEMMAATRGG